MILGYKKAPMDSLGDYFIARYVERIDGKLWHVVWKYFIDEMSHEEAKQYLLDTAKRKFPKASEC